jgi:phospholipase/carboxylesterase
MSTVEITTLEIAPSGSARSAIIGLHGLGADASDFEPIVPHLGTVPAMGLRFIFPNAPRRAMTVNGGMRMRAWYDILGLDIPRVGDAAGVCAGRWTRL